MLKDKNESRKSCWISIEKYEAFVKYLRLR